MKKKVAVLVGGSDLFSGMRGISPGTKMIQQRITYAFDEVMLINYNYFLDFGRAVQKIYEHIRELHPEIDLYLYGYSKGGDVVLRLARMLEQHLPVQLLVTIDIANGPWSHKVNRIIPGNVKRNINVYQTTPRFPLYSYGQPTQANQNTALENIDLSNQYIQGKKVNHSNIEMLMVDNVINWMLAEGLQSAPL